jgi:hypothetical protein
MKGKLGRKIFGFSSKILLRSFARRKTRIPKMQWNTAKEEESFDISDFMTTNNEGGFVSKLLEVTKNPVDFPKIFEENFDLMTPQESTSMLIQWIILKNDGLVSSFGNDKFFSLQNFEEKFLAKNLDFILESLDDVEDRDLFLLVKMLKITGILSEKFNVGFYRYCRENDIPLSLYGAIDLLDVFGTGEEYDQDLNYVSKCLAIVLSVNGFSSRDLRLKMKLLASLLKSKYAEADCLEIIENSLLDIPSPLMLKEGDIINVLSAYTESTVKGANYDLLDMFSIVLTKRIHKLDLKELRDLLLFCQKLKYEDVGILAGSTKSLFNIILSTQRSQALQLESNEDSAPQIEELQEVQLATHYSSETQMDYITSCLYSLLYLNVSNIII